MMVKAWWRIVKYSHVILIQLEPKPPALDARCLRLASKRDIYQGERSISYRNIIIVLLNYHPPNFRADRLLYNILTNTAERFITIFQWQ